MVFRVAGGGPLDFIHLATVTRTSKTHFLRGPISAQLTETSDFVIFMVFLCILKDPQIIETISKKPRLVPNSKEILIK